MMMTVMKAASIQSVRGPRGTAGGCAAFCWPSGTAPHEQHTGAWRKRTSEHLDALLRLGLLRHDELVLVILIS